VLSETGLDHLADEAVILATELTTNEVLRAGTAMDLQVRADPSGLMVMLSDPIRDRISPRGTATEFGPARRTLDLVDTVASSWGTSHNRHGKSVWFRLDTDRSGGAPAESASGTAGVTDEPVTELTPPAAPARPEPPRPAAPARPELPRPASRADATELSWLTHLPEAVTRQLTTAQTLSELLRRLCDTINAPYGVLWTDEGGETRPRAAAVHGLINPKPPRVLPDTEAPPQFGAASLPPAAAASVLRRAGARATFGVPVPFEPPLRGMLDLGTPDPDGFDHASYALAMLSAERMALVMDASRVRETEARRRGFLVFLAEASELLANSLDVDLTLVLVAQLCVNRLGEWCVIHTPDEYGRPELAATAHADERAIGELQKSFLNGGADAVEERLRRAVLSQSVVTLPDELAGIVVPLTARRHVVGTMSIGEPVGRRHTPEEVTIAEDLGRRAGLALDNARLYQDREAVATALQHGLLPASLPVAKGLEFGARYLPAGDSNEVGGDFYDVLTIDEDRWLLAIGDVCGKGPQAASATGLVRDVIRVLVREGRPLTYVMAALNAALLEQGDRARFCTVAAAVAERQGDTVRVQLCLAGHLPPALLRADGRATLIGDPGTAVGIFDTVEVTITEVELHPGDALIFYTDGVTERRNDTEFFGEDNLLSSLGECTGLDADAVAARLQTTASEFGEGPARDDIAVLVLRRLADEP
jgi:serine phosphatase RsbU (regulator of sigma subunit)